MLQRPKTHRMGSTTHRNQKSRHTTRHTEDPRSKRGNDHGRVATQMGTIKAPHKPFHVGRLPTALANLRPFALETAYVEPPGRTESPKEYKRRVYDAVRTLLRAETELRAMRIGRLEPNTNWEAVWKNLQTAPVPEETKSICYRLIHDIIPTNERLYKIRLAVSYRCKHCRTPSNIVSRLTATGQRCGNGQDNAWR
jgi:hypothetical protein